VCAPPLPVYTRTLARETDDTQLEGTPLSDAPTDSPRAENPWWFRAFLLVNVVQDFAVGVTGLRGGEHILVPLEDLSTLNARFIAALYLAGGLAILLAALAPRVEDTAPVVLAFWVITILVAVVTYAYWDDFTATGTPVMWLVTYTADPFLIAGAVLALGLWKRRLSGRHRFTPILLAQAAVLGAIGLVSLLAADAMVDVWPWAMTPILARVYAAFFLAFAAGALLAAWRPRRWALVPVFAGFFALSVLTIAVSLVHVDRFEAGAASVLWFGIAGAAAIAFGAALLLLARDRVDDAKPRPVPSMPR
jgi:peptidoglycan/LPS O-acetylase OafA/YrhL